MGCSTCSSNNGTPKGCGSNGGCSTGGCNKLNTYDWLSDIDLPDYGAYNLVEVSFKRGARKEIYKKPPHLHIATGDFVTAEGLGGGYDIGQVSLMGALVELQLKKHKIRSKKTLPKIIRVANERDLEKLNEARSLEKDTLIKSRVIARDLGLEMKIGDIEYQGDKRKVTIYYTADGRVDFRELIRVYAREFRVKIEMRQIGSRQESARIGGVGSCGRELCCSTWLTDFKSVSTAAARYQNLAINQSKLSGQCGRLKCCLNYELGTYLEVLKDFPKNVDKIKTKKGTATLIKTDIFKRIMYFAYRNKLGTSEINQLSVEQVKELKKLNDDGHVPATLFDISTKNNFLDKKEEEIEFVDNIDGVLKLEPLKKKKSKRRSKKRRRNRNKKSKGNSSNNKSNNSKQRNRNKRRKKKKKSSNTDNSSNKKSKPKPKNRKKRRRNKRKNKSSNNQKPKNKNNDKKNNK